jgi:anti-sigma factor RsiW
MGLLRKGNVKSRHKHMEEKLSAYLDGQLSPSERSALESHLGTCGQCQWNLQTLRTTVQWTRELPVVPVPRVFTIPAPVQPAREQRWRWSLPVLQGATALVALLFVFAVAGDVVMRGALPALAPRPEVALQPAPAADEAFEVEALPPSESTVLVESAVSEESPAVLPQAAPATELELEVEAEKVVATGAPESRALSTSRFEAPAGEGGEALTGAKEAAADAVAGEPQPGVAAEAVEQATALAEPTPTAVPTMPVATSEPTVIADAQAPAQPAREEEVQRPEGAYQPSIVRWLGVAEVVFGLAFVLLATLTIALTLWRLRTR